MADTDLALRRVDRATRSADNVHVDASGPGPATCSATTCRPTCCWSAPPTSRAACRSATEAIEQAIELNGAAVESNLAAFRWGRAAVADPGRGGPGRRPRRRPSEPDPRALDMLDGAPLERRAAPAGAAARRRADRLPEPRATPSATWTRSCAWRRVEHEQTGGGSSVAEAYAHGLHKLMAYKDEYEVARLHLLAGRGGAPRRRVRPRRQGADHAPAAAAARDGAGPQDQAAAAGRSRRWARCAAPGGCAAPRSTRSATRTCAGSSARWSASTASWWTARWST